MDKHILIYTQPYSGTWFLTNILKQTTRDLQVGKKGETLYYKNPPEIYTDSWFHTYHGKKVSDLNYLNNFIKNQNFNNKQYFSIHYGNQNLYNQLKSSSEFKIAYTIRHPLLIILSVISREENDLNDYFNNEHFRITLTKSIMKAQKNLMQLPNSFGLLLDKRFKTNIEYRILRTQALLKFFGIPKTKEGEELIKTNKIINNAQKWLKMNNKKSLSDKKLKQIKELKNYIYYNEDKTNKIFNIETKLLQKHYEKIKEWEKNTYRSLKVVFDLDNVIAMHYPNIKDYPINSKPNYEVIEKMRKLKEQDTEIVIYSARKMETSGHNVGRAIARAGKKTFDWLEKYNVPYDAIFFGKPNGDIYFDDKALNFDYQSLNTKLNCLTKEL